MGLEDHLNCDDKLDIFGGAFREYISRDGFSNLLDLLRKIKFFLGKCKPYRNKLFDGTLLRGSDCLTMATLANLLTYRNGYSTEICKPSSIINFCHVVLRYEIEGGEYGIFKVTGKTKHDYYIPLSDKDVLRRLKVTKPVIDWVNTMILRKY
jgi:hypothetical protein